MIIISQVNDSQLSKEERAKGSTYRLNCWLYHTYPFQFFSLASSYFPLRSSIFYLASSILRLPSSIFTVRHRPRAPGRSYTFSQLNKKHTHPTMFNYDYESGFPIPHDWASAHRRFWPPTPSDASDNTGASRNTPNTKPWDLFGPNLDLVHAQVVRYLRNNNPREVLVYIEGSCAGDGVPGAKAGYGIYCGPFDELSERLEGTDIETSNRAELRAAIVALTFRAWREEGFTSVVLACDSEYVVLGISERIQGWIERGWRTPSGSAVMDKDLWEVLLRKLAQMDDLGILVRFWPIARGHNHADRLAKAGVFKERRPYMDDLHADSLGVSAVGLVGGVSHYAYLSCPSASFATPSYHGPA